MPDARERAITGQSGRPLHVKLGPHSIEIRTDDETVRRLKETGDRGEARADALLVMLDPDGPHTAVAETLLHELLHHIWCLSPLKCDDALEDQHEKIVTTLAPWVLGLLRDNPHLVTYLTRQEPTRQDPTRR